MAIYSTKNYTAISHKHTNLFVYNNNWCILEKNAVDLILLPHKRRLNFDSGPDEELKGTEQPATKRKRKLIQKPQIKVLHNYLVHSLYYYMKNK